MRLAVYGDSLTTGHPGASTFQALEVFLAPHDITNHGRSGDTVISLYHRIARDRLCDPADVAILWVGVNDVLARASRTHSVLKRLTHQPPARDHGEFQDYYRRTLELLGKNARNILTVSPLLIGEDLENPWNRALEELCTLIASVCAPFDRVQYVDLRSGFAAKLKDKQPSEYVPKSITSIACEAVFLRTASQVDRAAARRGLHLTLDGVHLNSNGAQAVAEELRRALEGL